MNKKFLIDRGRTTIAVVGAMLFAFVTAEQADAKMTGKARTDYVNWSIESCTRETGAAMELLNKARIMPTHASVRSFCTCTANAEANRLGNKYAGEAFMVALRRAIPACLTAMRR